MKAYHFLIQYFSGIGIGVFVMLAKQNQNNDVFSGLAVLFSFIPFIHYYIMKEKGYIE